MKRIQLFEFEDQSWFPGWIRELMTRYIVAVHKMLKTEESLAGLLARALTYSKEPRIVDLCSGGGGPMPDVAKRLKSEHNVADLKVTFTDLYPNQKAAKAINSKNDASLHYETESRDATHLGSDVVGVRTMVCSLHHMPPTVATSILKSAQDAGQPICTFEISDNSHPKALWWIAIPSTFISVLFMTPMVRPFSWQQFVFTYLIPILPLFIAWDGAVSNARTYTISDMNELLKPLQKPGWTWETGIIKGRSKQAYLLGYPN